MDDVMGFKLAFYSIQFSADEEACCTEPNQSINNHTSDSIIHESNNNVPLIREKKHQLLTRFAKSIENHDR